MSKGYKQTVLHRKCIYSKKKKKIYGIALNIKKKET